MMWQVKQEYLPSTEPDTVTVTVASPGATPADVEQSIVLVLENAISGLDGIDKVSGNASEGSGTLTLELNTERPIQNSFNDIQKENILQIHSIKASSFRPQSNFEKYSDLNQS